MSARGGRIRLHTENATAEVALRGAEPVRWRVGERELLWRGDPLWWERTAPILFPVVGASRKGAVTIQNRKYSMPVHGFAKDRPFRLVDRQAASARLLLESCPATHAVFPFDFRLAVTVTLTGTSLKLSYDIVNTGDRVLPYALGFHPGFNWPSGEGVLEFETAENGSVPCIAPQGLIARRCRTVGLQGRRLPLGIDSFDSGALLFRNVRSQEMTLVGKHEKIRVRADGFRHFAIWSKPRAPFLCLETWTSHADWEDFDGELAQRDDIILLLPGGHRQHNNFIEFLPI